MIYSNIKHDIKHCTSCPLSSSLDYGCTPQWGAGSTRASILVVNLRVTQDMHLIEKPLEAKNSILLKKLLELSGIQESDVFVTNLLKCNSPITPAKPFKENISICRKQWLYKEISSLANLRAILVMGKQAGQIILDNKNWSIENIDNTDININGIKLFATHSLEEIFRKGKQYTDDAIETLKRIKEYNAKV